MEKGTKGCACHHAELKMWRVRLCLWAALIALVATPVETQAHAQLLRSNPADHSTLTQSPKQIDVWFSERLEDGFNVVEVFANDQPPGAKTRTNLARGKATLDSKDPTHLIVDLQPLPPGDYVVEWRVLSRDGHSAPGRINFRVLPPG